ncbi:YlbF family regulator [Clostridium sp. JNZ X4-2]
MSIYDKARELAEELKKTDEVLTLQKSSKKIEDNEDYKTMLGDFRKIQMEAYSEQVQNGRVSDEVMKKFKSMGAVISANTYVNEYIQAEQKFSIMWQDILKILNDAIGIDFSFEEDKNKGSIQ